MTIEAKIIADSISPEGIRLTTFQLRYPRFIHAELMTHRMFSRNASSSRAIPVERMIEDLRRDPAMPVYWGSNQKGMQAGAELSEEALEMVTSEWIHARDNAISSAEFMMQWGLHKQIANRILEPWAHINVVLTATSWTNFYNLRRHPDAQPEIKELADKMWNAHESGPMPKFMQPGEWHLPYIQHDDINEAAKRRSDIDNPHTKDEMINQDLIRVSVARCARVSYLTHDGRQTTMEEDLALYERLVGGMPLHASPAEHQATPDEVRMGPPFAGSRALVPVGYKNEKQHGNLHGWIQFRKTLPGEFTPG